MAAQPANELREMLKAALAAYERAQAVRLQEQRRADQVQAQEDAQRTRAHQSARAEAEAEHGRRLAAAGGEKERLAQLLGETAALEEAAQTLLKSAGLAHIAGAPAAADGTPAPARRSDAEVTAAFTAAHTAYVQLRTVLCQLAAAQVAAGRWEAARQTLQPLLLAKDAPLYTAAAELERDSYLRAAQQALDAEQWEAVRKHTEPWLKGHKEDEGAIALDRASYLLPARQAMEAKQWEQACEVAKQCLRQYKKDAEALALAGEGYYQISQKAVERKEWPLAVSAIAQALTLVQKPDSLALQQQAVRAWLDFVPIPAGEFLYGENKQRIQIAAFSIARTPITNAQYKVFVDVTGYKQPDHWSNGQAPNGKENHPVVNVSWEDAQAFCRWAGVRLPAEREWEKAARGADGRLYPWGSEPPTLNLCNFNNQVGDTTAVDQYPKGASPYGVLDMAGNVWEWCEDAYDGSSRVLRGGAFFGDESGVRCACRGWGDPTSRNCNIGFRVVAPSF